MAYRWSGRAGLLDLSGRGLKISKFRPLKFRNFEILVKKLKIFEDFDDSVGLLMAEALRVTQKVNIRQNMSLFEVTETLKDMLETDDLDPEERILQTRLFLQATEQQGKFYDRLLKGLEFQLKLANEKDNRETKKKPGFRPLKELKDVEEENKG